MTQKKQTSEEKRLKRELAAQAVDQWRGGCIRCFAQLEQGLVETLEKLAENGFSQNAADPGYVSMRLTRLMEIADEAASTNSAAKKLYEHLEELRRTLTWRAALTHGQQEVKLQPHGGWRVSLTHRPWKSGPTREVIDQAEAEARYRLLLSEVPKALQRMNAFVREEAKAN